MNAYTFVGQPVEPRRAPSFIDRIYETADGYITVSTMKDAEWKAFCAAAERPDLADDRFDTPAKRDDHVDERLAVIQEVLLTRTASECLKILPAHDVPCAPALRRFELLDHLQVLASGTIFESHHPLAAGCARRARRRGSPARRPRRRAALRCWASTTARCLPSWGIDDAEIDRLVAADVLGDEQRAGSGARVRGRRRGAGGV